MAGRYFFADYCSNRIWTLYDNGGTGLQNYSGNLRATTLQLSARIMQLLLYITGYSTGIIYLISDGSSGVNLDVNVFLEGPFSGTQMTTGLNQANMLPLGQPFNTAPWNYDETEMVTAIPNGNAVDWVLVELRDAPDAASQHKQQG